jgi:hypothetical protein
MLMPLTPVRYGADGCVPVLTIDEPYCCPPPLCGNALCCTFMAFVQLLPSGPAWDYWKEIAVSYFASNEDPAECPLLHDPACPSLVLHAIYCVLKLRHVVHNALWPAFRESNPNTAITTLDAHLARLQWEDCFNQHCRAVLLGELTPYEVWTECGPLFCPVELPAELECAVKRNVAIALTRANMGVIKNTCGLNWIIEPLGAEIKPAPPKPDNSLPSPDPCDSKVCTGMEFLICQTKDWIYGCPSGDVCEAHLPLPKVQAYWDRDCDRPAGLPERVWPAVLAAECIVRSMLPSNCPSTIKRCCA